MKMSSSQCALLVLPNLTLPLFLRYLWLMIGIDRARWIFRMRRNYMATGKFTNVTHISSRQILTVAFVASLIQSIILMAPAFSKDQVCKEINRYE